MPTKNGTLGKVILSVVSLAITIGATATITLYVRSSDTSKELFGATSTVSERVGVLEERVNSNKDYASDWRVEHAMDINRRLDTFSRRLEGIEAGQAAILAELGKIKGKM